MKSSKLTRLLADPAKLEAVITGWLAALLAAESAQTDTQINTQVAALYGLTPERAGATPSNCRTD